MMTKVSTRTNKLDNINGRLSKPRLDGLAKNCLYQRNKLIIKIV